jgi:hypothetical protein
MKVLSLSLLLVFVGLVAAWSKEGSSLTSPCNCVLILTLFLFCPDYEIFGLRDEVALSEGANVTFYGTSIYRISPICFILQVIDSFHC